MALNPGGFSYGVRGAVTPGDNKSAQITNSAADFVNAYAITSRVADQAEGLANLLVNDLKVRLLQIRMRFFSEQQRG